MPTYEYECGGCAHRFERFHKISDPPVRTCPTCGKPKVRRLISAGAGFIFKGSGFYVTDNKKSNASPGSAKKNTQRKVKGDSKAAPGGSAAAPGGSTESSTGKDSGGTE